MLKQTAQLWIKHARHWQRYSLLSIHWQERIFTSLTGAMGLPRSLWSSLTCNSCNACARWGLGMMITSQSCSDASHASLHPTDAIIHIQKKPSTLWHKPVYIFPFFFLLWHLISTSVITADMMGQGPHAGHRSRGGQKNLEESVPSIVSEITFWAFILKLPSPR